MIKDHFDKGNYGKSRKHSQRTLINAVLYVIKTGCQWRFLPKEYPPWKTVYIFYKRAKDQRIWEKMMKDLVEKSRIKMGRDRDPSYCLIDSQSVKTTDKAAHRGIDGGKKIKGRKRHIVTDTQGHLLHVKVHAANTHDTVAGGEVFKKALETYPNLQGVCADAGYRKTFVEFVTNILKKTIEISERIQSGWTMIPKRWVVERTFAWLNHFRRLSKDYEISTKTAENNIRIAHSMILINRLA